MFINNKKTFLEILKKKKVYSVFFCRFCERNRECEKDTFPKILQINSEVLSLYNENEKPYPGTNRQQPIFFKEMVKHINKVKETINKENAEKNKGKK